MNEFKPLNYNNPDAFYRELRQELRGLYEPTWFTNLANLSAAVMANLPDINWVGFYLLVDEELRLGPFQGLPACVRIPMGKGVCGAAAQKREAMIVADVHRFPGHIACDARSRSELVIPLLREGRLLGVLDIDSPSPARFGEGDRLGFEQLVIDLVAQTTWPAHFI